MNFISTFTTSFLSIGLTMISLLLIKLILDKGSQFKKISSTELINSKEGLATSIKRAGIFIGLMIGSLGVLSKSLTEQACDQLLLLIFMLIAIVISDKILFSKISNKEEVFKGNISLAISEFGLFLGTGIIAYGSFYGEGPWYSSIVFFLLGQLTFIFINLIYEKTYKDIKNSIIDNKISSGLFFGSIMIAQSIIIKTAIIGDFTSWTSDLISFIELVIIGFSLLYIFTNTIIDKVFLPKITIKEALKQDLMPPIIIISSIKIGLAILINLTI